MAEQVAVRQAERQRERGAVGEAADGDGPTGNAGEHRRQRLVEEPHVRPVAAADDVPGAAAGVRRQHEQVAAGGLGGEQVHHLATRPTRAVQRDEQGKGRAVRRVLRDAVREDEHPVARSAEAQRVRAGLSAGCVPRRQGLVALPPERPGGEPSDRRRRHTGAATRARHR